MSNEHEKITVEQKVTIEVLNWKQFNDISINQGSNSIYIDKDKLQSLIDALKKFVE